VSRVRFYQGRRESGRLISSAGSEEQHERDAVERNLLKTSGPDLEMQLRSVGPFFFLRILYKRLHVFSQHLRTRAVTVSLMVPPTLLLRPPFAKYGQDFRQLVQLALRTRRR
jgi:hypothetical protein